MHCEDIKELEEVESLSQLFHVTPKVLLFIIPGSFHVYRSQARLFGMQCMQTKVCY